MIFVYKKIKYYAIRSYAFVSSHWLASAVVSGIVVHAIVAGWANKYVWPWLVLAFDAGTEFICSYLFEVTAVVWLVLLSGLYFFTYRKLVRLQQSKRIGSTEESESPDIEIPDIELSDIELSDIELSETEMYVLKVIGNYDFDVEVEPIYKQLRAYNIFDNQKSFGSSKYFLEQLASKKLVKLVKKGGREKWRCLPAGRKYLAIHNMLGYF